MNTPENPYRSPPPTRIKSTPGGASRVFIRVLRVVMGIEYGVFLGAATWIILLLGVFGNSTEYWPAWVCAIPAVVVGGTVFWLGAFYQPGAHAK